MVANVDGVRMSDYYRQTFVMERVSQAKAIRYVCYEDLRTRKFCVSSAEELVAPENAETLTFHAVRRADHFMKEGVNRWFDTLLEAVEDFALVMDNEREG